MNASVTLIIEKPTLERLKKKKNQLSYLKASVTLFLILYAGFYFDIPSFQLFA